MEEQTEQSQSIQYIPKDAVIPLQVGAGFLQRLQKMLVYVIQGKSEKELEDLRKHIENNTVPEDSWMYHYQTVQSFIITIEQSAIDNKITVLKSE